MSSRTLLSDHVYNCSIELQLIYDSLPVTVAERSKACTAFDRSEAGIMGLNSVQDMDVLCL
jgi:hypothetical protein